MDAVFRRGYLKSVMRVALLAAVTLVACAGASPPAPVVALPPPWQPEMLVLERSFQIDEYCAYAAVSLGRTGGRCIQTPDLTVELFQRSSPPEWTRRSTWVDFQGRRFAVGSALPETNPELTMRLAVRRGFGHLLRPPPSTRSGMLTPAHEFTVARALDFYVAPDGTAYVLLVQR